MCDGCSEIFKLAGLPQLMGCAMLVDVYDCFFLCCVHFWVGFSFCRFRYIFCEQFRHGQDGKDKSQLTAGANKSNCRPTDGWSA